MSLFLPPSRDFESDGTVVVFRRIPLMRPGAKANPSCVEERSAGICPNSTLGGAVVFQGPPEPPADDEVEP